MRKKKEKNLLIAQIGRNSYKATNYRLNDDSEDLLIYAETGYTFEAVMSKIENVDIVILVGTKGSYWGTLCYYYRTLEENEKEEIFEKKHGEAFIRANEIEWDKAETEKEKVPELKRYMEACKDTRANKGKEMVGGYMIRDIDNKEVKEQVEEYLTNQLRKKCGNSVVARVVLLEYGKDNKELQNNFEFLKDETTAVLDMDEFRDSDINIHFDISNGFRSLPVYIYSFVNYMTRIRDVKFNLHMYYGMFEAAQTDKETNKKYTCLVDMEDVTELMDWINAVNEFRNYGSVKQICRVLNGSGTEDIESENEEKKSDWNILVEEDIRLSDVFQMFERGTNMNDLGALKRSLELIISLRKVFKDNPEAKNLSKSERLLLENISEEFQRRFQQNVEDDEYSYARLTLSMAKWYLDQGRIGNAAIAVMEGSITCVMECFPEETAEYLKVREMPDYKGKKDVFIYKYRNEVKDSLRSMNNDFSQKYDALGKIRNRNSHILFNEGDSNDAADEELIQEVILTVLEVLEDPQKASVTFEGIYRQKEKYLRNKKSTIHKEDLRNLVQILSQNMRKGNLEIPNADIFGDEKVISNWNKFCRQMYQLRQYYIEDCFDRYYEHRDEIPMVTALFYGWMWNVKKVMNKEEMEAFFAEKKRKPGYIRLLGYFSKECDLLLALLTETNI